MGVKIKMTQKVCGMGGFPAQKACFLQQYLLNVLEMCGMGALSEKLWRCPEVFGKGGVSAMKVHTIWVFLNFHFRACYSTL